MRARRRFAQHFLEPAWVAKVAACLAPREEDAILEVGPGRGALTLAIAAAGPTMTVVELDRDLAADLAPRLPSHVTLVEGDVLDVDLAGCLDATLARRAERFGERAGGWPATVRIAGNLPYNISTPLIARLVALARDTGRVRDAVLMVQLEVARRLAAAPGSGDYGPLSVLGQLWADVELVLRLPPGAFRPPPRVQSSVVRLRFRSPSVAIADLAVFERLVRAIFLQRRKMLSNALAPFGQSLGRSAQDALARADIDGRRRPETLSLTELARLAGQFAMPTPSPAGGAPQ